MPYSARWLALLIGPVGRMFGMRQVCRVVVALSALLGGASSAQATDLFVDPLGNDSNSCMALATACLTLQAAINKASSTDTIHVADGMYASGLVTVDKTLTLLGAQAGVDARTRVGAESVLSNSQGMRIAANAVVIDGFTIQDSINAAFTGYGVSMDLSASVSGTQIVNNIIQDNIVGIGLANAGQSQALIQHNLIQNNNQPGGASGSGIYADQFVCGVNCTNFLITENAFKGHVGSPVPGAAINLSNQGTTPMTNVEIGNNTFELNNRAVLLFNVDASTIHNNTMTDSTFVGSGDIRIFGADAFGGVDGLAITSNNMSGGAGWAIRITDGPNTNITIHENNIANYAGDGPVLSPFGGGLFVRAGAHPGTLDATCNWWDDPCGPFNVTNNPLGIGEEVHEEMPSNVNFSPWLIAPGPAPRRGRARARAPRLRAGPPPRRPPPRPRPCPPRPARRSRPPRPARRSRPPRPW
jgi:hypothetical protein